VLSKLVATLAVGIFIVGGSHVYAGVDPADLCKEKKAKATGKKAFDLLVLKYQHRIMKVLSRYMYDQHEVQDLAQEAFIKAYRALPNFRGDSAFYTWLYRICMNLSINSLKRHKRVMTESRFKEEAKPLEREAGGEDPSSSLARREMEQKIEKAIDSLSPKYKAVFVLRIYDEMSYEQIAESLNISVGTVMSRLYRAREKMQEMLKEYKE